MRRAACAGTPQSGPAVRPVHSGLSTCAVVVDAGCDALVIPLRAGWTFKPPTSDVVLGRFSAEPRAATRARPCAEVLIA